MVDAYNAWTAASDQAIYDWFDSIGEFLDEWWTEQTRLFKKWWDTQLLKFKAWWADFKTALVVWLGGIAGDIMLAWLNIIATAQRLWDDLRLAISTAMDNIRNYISSVFNDPRTGILAFLSSIDLAEIGEGIFTTLWNGFKNVWRNVIIWINDKIAALWAVIAQVSGLAGVEIGPAPQITVPDAVAMSAANQGNLFGAGLGGVNFAGLGAPQSTEIRLIIDNRTTGRQEELSFRLGESRQFLIDMGQLRSAR
jgi:hypothetical protein